MRITVDNGPTIDVHMSRVELSRPQGRVRIAGRQRPRRPPADGRPARQRTAWRRASDQRASAAASDTIPASRRRAPRVRASRHHDHPQRRSTGGRERRTSTRQSPAQPSSSLGRASAMRRRAGVSGRGGRRFRTGRWQHCGLAPARPRPPRQPAHLECQRRAQARAEGWDPRGRPAATPASRARRSRRRGARTASERSRPSGARYPPNGSVNHAAPVSPEIPAASASPVTLADRGDRGSDHGQDRVALQRRGRPR